MTENETRALAFKFGTLINSIAMLSDDENLSRIKGSLDELEHSLINLFDEIDNMRVAYEEKYAEDVHRAYTNGVEHALKEA